MEDELELELEEELDELCPLCPEEGREPGKLVIKLELDGCIDGGLDHSHMKATFDGEIRGETAAEHECRLGSFPFRKGAFESVQRRRQS